MKKEAYKRLKKECQKQKQWIAEYQLLIRAGASGSHKVPFVCALGLVLDEGQTPTPNSSRDHELRPDERERWKLRLGVKKVKWNTKT